MDQGYGDLDRPVFPMWFRLKVRPSVGGDQTRDVILAVLERYEASIETVSMSRSGRNLSDPEKAVQIADYQADFTVKVNLDGVEDVAGMFATIGEVKFFGERWTDPFGFTSTPRDTAAKGDYVNRCGNTPGGALRDRIARSVIQIREAVRAARNGDSALLYELSRAYNVRCSPFAVGSVQVVANSSGRDIHAYYFGCPMPQ